MNPTKSRILIIPGFQGSNPKHWQSIWEQEYSADRVHQKNWFKPKLEDWVHELDLKLSSHGTTVLPVAHSLGCLTLAHWAAANPHKTHLIEGALLVSPPDLSQENTPDEVVGFRLPKLQKLNFRSIVVASSNDPWAADGQMKLLADGWGSEFQEVGELGHIGDESSVGAWTQGKAIFERLFSDESGSFLA